MLKIKDDVDLRELKKLGFRNMYECYENWSNGLPIHWWNDGRDKERYRYYQYGMSDYDVCLRIYEKDRKLFVIAPNEYDADDVDSHLDVIYILTKWGFLESVGDDNDRKIQDMQGNTIEDNPLENQ